MSIPNNIIGKYIGTGQGEYPTIKPFTYNEEVEFSNNGKPFVFYQQKTWIMVGEEKKPMHSESGYIRFIPNGTIEMVLSEPTGIAETYSGTISTVGDDTTLNFTSLNISRTPSAKPPHTTNITRLFIFNKTSCAIKMSMATETTPLTHHLSSVLIKQ